MGSTAIILNGGRSNTNNRQRHFLPCLKLRRFAGNAPHKSAFAIITGCMYPHQRSQHE